MGEHNSYLAQLKIEDPEQKASVMRAHLRGLKGWLETLQGWKDDKPEYKKFFDRTFGNQELKPNFEGIYEKLLKILSDEGSITQETYDNIYKEWEQLSKHIGN
jgi:hypothetical protein